MNAMSVGRPSSGRHALYNMRDVIQERHPLYVVSVENNILTNMVSLTIRGVTQERNPMSARNVGKPSPQGQSSMSIRELI